MASGVSVHPDCLTTFESLKLGHKLKYIVYTLSPDNTHIVVEKSSAAGSYDDFVAGLPEDQCRYAVYDFDYQTQEGQARNKIIFIIWSPDGSRIKQKMVFASSKDALRRALQGIATDIQATDFSEIAHESVVDKVSRLSK